MADEITLEINIHVDKNTFQKDINERIEFDLSGAGGGNPGLVDIGSGAEEDIDFGDVSGGGLIFMQNLGSNPVNWGKKDGSGNMQAIGTLAAIDADSLNGGMAVFTMESTATLRMQASGGSSKVFIWRLEA